MTDNKDVKKDKFTVLIQIVGFSTVVASLFGVSFQKGMILEMNLGNLAGSYEIREVFNSAIMAYVYVASKIGQDDIIAAFFANSYILAVFLFLGFLLPILYKNKKKVEAKLNVWNTELTYGKAKDRVCKSFVWSPVLALISGIFALGSIFAASYFIFLFIALLIFPSVIGYVVGGYYVKSLMENDVCVKATKEMLAADHLRQCTQISIQGKKIKGEIVLENNDAYFIRRNSAFLYVTKNGSTCIYSIYAKSEDIKQLSDLRFTDDEINNLCSVEHSKDWKKVTAATKSSRTESK